MPGPYTVGGTIKLEILLSDPDTGLPVTANDITCRVQPPGGGAVVPVAPVTLIDAGAGAPSPRPAKYRASYPMALAGEHWFEFASATLAMQREDTFYVEASKVT